MNDVLLRALANVLAIVGTSFLLPIAVSFHYGETKSAFAFAAPMAASWLLAGWLALCRRGKARLRYVDNAFLVVGGVWIAIGLFGAVPLWASGAFPSFTDAVFESVSGFTTTGASVLSEVESLPHAVNLWRCQTHWLGGMGVIALAVALMPLLGAGGYRMIQAESSGPEKGKLTARIADTAKVLWVVYFVLSVIQAILLHVAGLGWFDSVCHTFSTMGTGGFSTRNASVGAFGLPAVEWICTVFMLLASVNFGCYYLLLRGRLAELRDNTELRGFLILVLVATGICATAEWIRLGAFGEAVRGAAFQVASIISTTGFMTSDYTTWLPVAQMAILALFLTGGCSGSTAGGVKVIRWSVLAKELRNDILHLRHPHGVFTLRLNGNAGREDVVPLVGSFIFVYLLLVLVVGFIGAGFGLDVHTAFTAALSMVGNVGPAFGALGPTENFGALPAALKWTYCLAMLAGRLEIYTLLLMVGRSAFTRRVDVSWRGEPGRAP